VLKLVSDENFNADILRGLFRRHPDLDVVRVQDFGLSATPDSDILAWAAVEGRIVLTHDRDTMLHFLPTKECGQGRRCRAYFS
jgi:predicted nuclease of predicted toxin-antitoxin system